VRRGPILFQSHFFLMVFRDHIDSELKLYACISEQCIEPPQHFATSEEWREHLDKEHSPQWVSEVHKLLSWSCNMGHDEEWFDEEIAFRKHAEHWHPKYAKGPDLEDLKQWCEVRRPRPAQSCPICNSLPEKLSAIMAKDVVITSERSTPASSNQNEVSMRAELLRHIAQHLKAIGLMSITYLEDYEEDEDYEEATPLQLQSRYER
jgi:hypothetical protein